MKLKYFIPLAGLLCFGANAFAIQHKTFEYLDQIDPNILIFSQSHAPVSYTEKKEGVLSIGITTFQPILHIDINGKIIKVPEDTEAQVDFSFVLAKETTSFLVTVVTKTGKKQKTFTVHLSEKPQPQANPFMLIGKVNITNLDNVTNSASDTEKKSGTKVVLIAIPQYRFSFKKGSSLNIKGILLREKFSDKTLSANELAFSQVVVQWKEMFTYASDLTLSIGLNDIRTDNDNLATGETQTATETFISGDLKQNINHQISWNLHMNLKLKDSKTEISDLNDEADARETSLKTGIAFQTSNLKGYCKIGYGINDAKGKYQDSSNVNYKAKLLYPVGDWIAELGYSGRQKTMKIEDNRQGIRPKSITATPSLKISYKLISKTHIALQIKSKKQTSNVDEQNYSVSSANLSLTHLF